MFHADRAHDKDVYDFMSYFCTRFIQSEDEDWAGFREGGGENIHNKG